MTLKTIEEHNSEIRRLTKNKFSTGVACPNCKDKELQFTNHTMMLSFPPQKDVKCFECGYTGRIYVL